MIAPEHRPGRLASTRHTRLDQTHRHWMPRAVTRHSRSGSAAITFRSSAGIRPPQRSTPSARKPRMRPSVRQPDSCCGRVESRTLRRSTEAPALSSEQRSVPDFRFGHRLRVNGSAMPVTGDVRMRRALRGSGRGVAPRVRWRFSAGFRAGRRAGRRADALGDHGAPGHRWPLPTRRGSTNARRQGASSRPRSDRSCRARSARHEPRTTSRTRTARRT